MNEIILDGENLTFEQVLAVAFGKPNAPRVKLSENAEAQVKRSANAVQKLTRTRRNRLRNHDRIRRI